MRAVQIDIHMYTNLVSVLHICTHTCRVFGDHRRQGGGARRIGGQTRRQLLNPLLLRLNTHIHTYICYRHIHIHIHTHIHTRLYMHTHPYIKINILKYVIHAYIHTQFLIHLLTLGRVATCMWEAESDKCVLPNRSEMGTRYSSGRLPYIHMTYITTCIHTYIHTFTRQIK